ncbi:DDE-type integrase/transposase/recombinase [Allofournierella massiliensis]|uniref:DDE-type integrase/transposase/recombinase n=1 Tax=Allofournierella massiliensis TaxID=1650663 RepID=UPI0039A115A3
MKFIAIKTDDGTIKGKLTFYCRMLHVSRQGFYKYLSVKDRPWKYQALADTMLEIHAEDVCNDTYGRVRMFQALTLKRNPKGVTKADREARKSDGKLYVSATFDCFDSAVLGLAMKTTMKATLCQHTVENAFIAYPEIRGAVLHSDRGSQYTSELYRSTLRKCEIIQSMNSAGGRCHDNARCESMWARLKTELLYDRYNSENLTVSELKSLIWRYFISYWNNHNPTLNVGFAERPYKGHYSSST